MRGVKVVSRIRQNFVILKINLSLREKKNDVTMFKNKRERRN